MTAPASNSISAAPLHAHDEASNRGPSFLPLLRSRLRALRVLLLLPLTLLPACVKNAATGETYYSLDALGGHGAIHTQAVALGEQAQPDMVKEYGGAVTDPDLQKYVTDIGKKLAAGTEADNPSYPWQFTLLNTSVVNAFALPGGKVFFTRGLAERLTNEAQMAGVLGHEIGHVTAEHAMRQIAQQGLINGGLAVASAAVDASDEKSSVHQYGANAIPALQIGGQLVTLKFSRDDESQADMLGMRYMAKAGYNPRAQLQVMQVLKQLSAGDTTPEMLQTHPLPDTRIQRVTQLLNTTYKADAANPNNQFYEDRYKTMFLDKLKKLPPPPAPPAQPAAAPATTTDKKASGLRGH